MKTRILFIVILVFISLTSSNSQVLYRKTIAIPDISGYLTLKADFHIHTVFSNGLVWPTVRVQEAWMEGLDVIAFTDHLEYHTFDKDVVYDDNRATEVAKSYAQMYGMVLIKGTEITRSQPLGHFNAIFTTDNNKLRVKDSILSITTAGQQGAFITWNHPHENNKGWNEVQEMLFKQGLMNGIEVANHNTYFPEAQQWCMDKNLTMMGTSDVHNPITFDYNFQKGEHRTLTLVFAKEKTPESIQEALNNHRTAAYWKDKIIGKEEFLSEIFKNSVSFLNTTITINKKNKIKAVLYIKNSSDIPYKIKFTEKPADITIPTEILLEPGKTSAIDFDGKSPGQKLYSLTFEVTNLLVGPNKPYVSTVNLTVVNQ